MNHTNNARHAKDPALNTLANQLDLVVWQTELTADEKAVCDHLIRDHTASRRLLCPLPDYRTWAVRMYLGGAQRTMGLAKTNLHGAIRFADMASMHFWKYRIRGACEPGDERLNLSAERAKADLLFEPNALELLTKIEKYLVSLGVLVTAKEMERRRLEDKESFAKLRTVRGELLQLNDVWLTRHTRFETRLGEVNTKLDTIVAEQKRLHSLFERILLAAGAPSVPLGTADNQPVSG
jgi:hypothetical protein